MLTQYVIHKKRRTPSAHFPCHATPMSVNNLNHEHRLVIGGVLMCSPNPGFAQAVLSLSAERSTEWYALAGLLKSGLGAARNWGGRPAGKPKARAGTVPSDHGGTRYQDRVDGAAKAVDRDDSPGTIREQSTSDTPACLPPFPTSSCLYSNSVTDRLSR